MRVDMELKAQEGIVESVKIDFVKIILYLAELRKQQGLPPELTDAEKKEKKKKSKHFYIEFYVN